MSMPRLAKHCRGTITCRQSPALAVASVLVIGTVTGLPLVQTMPIATGLSRDIARVATHDEDGGRRFCREKPAFVLEQHHRFANGAPGNCAVAGGTDQGHLAHERARRRATAIETARVDLQAQDSADRVVEARGGDLARLRLSERVGIERLPAAARIYDHVEPGR
jgi:hypothetical protein